MAAGISDRSNQSDIRADRKVQNSQKIFDVVSASVLLLEYFSLSY
jgi:hypothetical protein